VEPSLVQGDGSLSEIAYLDAELVINAQLSPQAAR
jgi:hypothetical protein